MTWMSGAKRHWPAAVSDTERDMSRELNTGEGGFISTATSSFKAPASIMDIDPQSDGILPPRKRFSSHSR